VSSFSAAPLSTRRHHSLLVLGADTSSTDTFAAFAESLEDGTIIVEKEEEKHESWQERLEMLLDPLTPLARRQILLSELMASNEDIRRSVTVALRERNVSTEKNRNHLCTSVLLILTYSCTD
jgi:hypothetical protein